MPSYKRRHKGAGYILLEVLTALGVFGVGILPAAWLAPVAAQWWREQGMVAQGLRIAVEAAEMGRLAGTTAGGLPASLPATIPLLSLRTARGLPPPHWCLAVPDAEAAGTCPPGPRILMVGPLPYPPAPSHTRAAASRRLRAIALRLQP